VLLRADGKAFNFTTQGWDSLPSTGIPPAANFLTLTQPVTAGPIAANWFGTLPTIASSVGNVSGVVVSLDATGNVLAQLNAYPAEWLDTSPGAHGGYAGPGR
jgi:hypothetical protein